MERERLAVVAVVVGVGLFGAAIAARTTVNPWWTNAGVAAVVLAASASFLRGQLASLLEVRWRSLAISLLLAALMVAATHLSFAFAVEFFPSLEGVVGELYHSIDEQSPGRVASVILIVIVVLAEEALWRGVAVELCVKRLGRALTGFAVVLLYAVPQLVGGDWVLLAAALGAGTVFTVQRLTTGGLLAPIVTHAIWSVCIFSLVPLR